VQFGIAQRDSLLYDIGSGPTTNGFESDNDGSGTNANPYTEPVFSNMTLIGPLANGKPLDYTNSFQNGARIRRASGLSLFNSVIIGFPTGVFIDGARSAQKLANDTLLFRNNVIGGYTVKPMAAASGDQNNVISKIMGAGNDTLKSASGILEDPFNYSKPNFAAKGSIATTGSSFSGSKISNSFFEATTYRGAISTANDWTASWANFDPQNTDYSVPAGVEEVEWIQASVYPNPANNSLTLATNFSATETVSLDIISMSGQVVKSLDQKRMNAGSQTISIDVAELNAGMYLLRLQTQHGQRTVRFSIAR
jgi:hypothetical protein